ncbi:hypothetical protein M011DRAFT_432054 [Sporormia fimetaria CBS 119925]|uniref:TFIIS N-terminal domain-containing protein n=1 Tax=Sporormia fimetaria CBS 119925 TaxID=1340428 RepID=A0A6A6UXK8_9PLEO|nr:hypothetical protein M011DRAFT_432054 [Sporormia fimetaria CBS 119925]
MEDVTFERSHSNSPLPEAGHDPGDPLRPEIDEENSTPNPPITDPYKDMEVVEPDEKNRLPDQDDLQEAGLSDDESVLSEVDEAQFEDFDVGDINVEQRPAQVITDVSVIGVHKRKRAEGEGEAPKKKKKRADKPKRRKKRDEEVGEGEELGPRKSRRSRKEGRVRDDSPEDDNLTPEERRRRALERQLDASLKTTNRRPKRLAGEDLEQDKDREVEDMRRRMTAAAEADNNDRQNGIPARHKLKLLPEVVGLLNKPNYESAITDPDTNVLEAVRYFLEPLNDGSLPAYDIQKELFAALGKINMPKETLVASGIGKVILFYIKSARPEQAIKRQAERLFSEWTRPILGRADDYRKKQVQTAEYDPRTQRGANARPALSQAAALRAKDLEAPKTYQRARFEGGAKTYTIAPRSKTVFNQETGRGRAPEPDIMRKIKNRQGRR